MYTLVTFSTEQPARLLSHYLAQQGIGAEYAQVQGDYTHAVILLDLEHQLHAKSIAEAFLLDPQDQKYQSSAWLSGQSVSLQRQSTWSWRVLFTHLRQAPFTASVLVLCLLFYCLAIVGFTLPYQSLQIQPLGIMLDSHQWWRLVGPALIHFSLLHITFNVLWWWTLGSQLEKSFGLSTGLLLVLFSAIVSNLAQLWISGPNFGGLSGVVYALVGCVWWLGWLRPEWSIALPKALVGFLLIWLLVGYMDILPVNMANTAHTVGLICGCLFAWLLSKYAKKSHADE
jgi:GlpG protein